MKQTLVVALAALAVSAACFKLRAAIADDDASFSMPFFDVLGFGDHGGPCGARGSREIATRDFVWQGNDSVSIAIPGKIQYRRGEGERVSMRARSWVLDHVVVENGRIAYDCRLNSSGPVEITLPGVPMKSITLSGAGKLHLDGVQQDEFAIAVNGAGKVEANGRADNASISIAGVGEVKMGGLAARNVNVNIAGAGDVDVSPQDSANVSIAGAGNVRLLTEPKQLTTHIAGAGKILHGPR